MDVYLLCHLVFALMIFNVCKTGVELVNGDIFEDLTNSGFGKFGSNYLPNKNAKKLC